MKKLKYKINTIVLLLTFATFIIGISCSTPVNDENTSPVVDESLAWNHHGIGTNHTVAISASGTVGAGFKYFLYSWGDNSSGQLGYTSSNENKPKKVNNDEDWSLVFARQNSSMAIKIDGSLWAWGFNGQGQLGNGTTDNIAIPTKINNGPWKTLAMGDGFTLGIKVDGTLWTWGLNENGQLGNNTFTNSLVPQSISNTSDWIQVSAGWAHSFAIKQNGSLYGWGRNNENQLGNGTPISSEIPILINASQWKKIAAGKMHSVGIKTDGTLWATGRNNVGQLGTGFVGDNFMFTQIGSATDWGWVEAGSNHNIAFKLGTYGSFWTWGYNQYGQLGTGDGNKKYVPTLIKNDELLSARASENNTSVLYRISGRHIYTSGDNAKGQIGNGNNTNYNVFTKAFY